MTKPAPNAVAAGRLTRGQQAAHLPFPQVRAKCERLTIQLATAEALTSANTDWTFPASHSRVSVIGPT